MKLEGKWGVSSWRGKVESRKWPIVWAGTFLVLMIFVLGMALLAVREDILNRKMNEADFRAAEEEFFGLYVEANDVCHVNIVGVPRGDVTEGEIEAVEQKLMSMETAGYEGGIGVMRGEIEKLRDMIALREEAEALLENGVLKSAVKAEDVAGLWGGYEQLERSYRKAVEGKVAKVFQQWNQIQEAGKLVAGLFMDEGKSEVRREIVRRDYQVVKDRVNAIGQKEVKERYLAELAVVDRVLVAREKAAAEAAARAAEARRRAEELRRQQEKEIAEAWRVINVPYHSQSLQQIYNGCEAASLLMGLQYKGYLGRMDLRTYVELMPKSNDPFVGFTHSVYDFEPREVPHWIAPGALAKFGRESSGNERVVDATGMSLDELDKEVLAGNPVVIYVTWLFNPTAYWAEGAPKNLHVLVLTGYNEATGAQRLTDPWTQAYGRTTWDIPKATLEEIYNAVGRKAVVIR